jgi:Asp-tRNA(Asn)/Glu-tRNA(Gln) amidotransferase A subunit family amidase
VFRDLFRKGENFTAGNQIVEKQIELLRGQRTVIADGLTTGLDLAGMFPVLRVNDFEFKVALDSYLRTRGPSSPVKSFSDIMSSGKYSPHLQASFERRLKMAFPEFDPEYLSRLENAASLRQNVISLMDRYAVDALVYPFKSVGARTVGTSEGDTGDNPLSAVTGLPAIVVPAGFDADGLPIAIEFLGRPFSEHRLFQIAHAYEQASPRRVPPSLLR